VNTDYRILCVDDDEDILWANKMILSGEGFKVDICTDPEEALRKIKSEQFHVLIIDYMMPKIRGDQLANMILTLDKSVSIIFLTGYSEYDVYMKMVGGIDNMILYKPVSGKELIDAVNFKINNLQNVSDSVNNMSAFAVDDVVHQVK